MCVSLSLCVEFGAHIPDTSFLLMGTRKHNFWGGSVGYAWKVGEHTTCRAEAHCLMWAVMSAKREVYLPPPPTPRRFATHAQSLLKPRRTVLRCDFVRAELGAKARAPLVPHERVGRGSEGLRGQPGVGGQAGRRLRRPKRGAFVSPALVWPCLSILLLYLSVLLCLSAFFRYEGVPFIHLLPQHRRSKVWGTYCNDPVFFFAR